MESSPPPTPKNRLTASRKARFLQELESHGIVARAARAASPGAHHRHSATKTFYDERQRDEAFAERWDEAIVQAKGSVERELHRRAVEGWEEPIYGGRFRESVVGSVRRYSDRLLELRVKGLLPQYRENSKLNVSGSVSLDLAHERQRQIEAHLKTLSAAALLELRAMAVRAKVLMESGGDAARPLLIEGSTVQRD